VESFIVDLVLDINEKVCYFVPEDDYCRNSGGDCDESANGTK